MKRIIWNEAAIEQGAAELEPDEVQCEDCGTSPVLRQFGRYFCKCGKLEGAVSDKR
jgi:hypothetical protein